MWPVRAELAAELADGEHTDIVPEHVWTALINDPDEEVRLSLVGDATPDHVLAVLVTDDRLDVRDAAQRHLSGRRRRQI